MCREANIGNQPVAETVPLGCSFKSSWFAINMNIKFEWWALHLQHCICVSNLPVARLGGGGILDVHGINSPVPFPGSNT